LYNGRVGDENGLVDHKKDEKKKKKKKEKKNTKNQRKRKTRACSDLETWDQGRKGCRRPKQRVQEETKKKGMEV